MMLSAMIPAQLTAQGAPSDTEATEASRETAPPASTDEAPTLTYGAVDQAVVRVFSVSNVTTMEVRGEYVLREIALPQIGHGSGLLATPLGHIITAHHVIEGAHAIAVQMPGDSRIFPAVVVHENEAQDIAVLRIPRGHGSPRPLPTDGVQLSVRQTVSAIGYPLDPNRQHPQSSRGIVAGLLEDGSLQLDISLNPGNSGGPLIDENDQIIGMVVARGRLERGIQNIGIAVPLPRLRAALAAASQPDWSVPGAARGVAQFVALLMLLGPDGVIDDISQDLGQEPGRVRQLRQYAARSQDPDLLVLAAAFLWDAALVVLENNGGVAHPLGLDDPVAQRRVAGLVEEAQDMCRRALRQDSTIGERSPWVERMARRAVPTALPGRGRLVTGYRQGVDYEVPGSARGRVVVTVRERGRYLPLFSMGVGYDLIGQPLTGGGTILQPLAAGEYNAPVRAIFYFGTSAQYGRAGDDSNGTAFFAGEIGAGVRLGYPAGIFLGLSWTPAWLMTDDWRADGLSTHLTALGVSAKIGLMLSHYMLLFDVHAIDGSNEVPGFLN